MSPSRDPEAYEAELKQLRTRQQSEVDRLEASAQQRREDLEASIQASRDRLDANHTREWFQLRGRHGFALGRAGKSIVNGERLCTRLAK